MLFKTGFWQFSIAAQRFFVSADLALLLTGDVLKVQFDANELKAYVSLKDAKKINFLAKHFTAIQQPTTTINTEITIGSRCYLVEGGVLPSTENAVVGVVKATDNQGRLFVEDGINKLKAILNNMPLLLYSFKPNGQITYVGGRGAKLFGSKLGKRVGCSLFDIYKNKPKDLAYIKKALLGNSVYTESAMDDLHIARYLQPFKNHQGQVTEVIGITIDITAQKLTSSQLHIFKAAVANAQDVVIITNNNINQPGPNIVYINPAIKKELGYSPEEVLGKSPRIFQGPDTSKEALSELKDALIAQKAVTVDLLNYHKNGTTKWVQLSIFPIWNGPDVLPSHYVAIQRDISAKKAHEKEILVALEKSHELAELKSKFIEMATHQFKTPIAVIKSNMELLKIVVEDVKDVALKEKMIRYAKRSVRQSHKIERLMNDILLKGKMDAGKLNLQLTPLNISELVAEAIEQLDDFSWPNIPVRVAGAPKPVPADANLLEQAILNLLNNAIKYSSHQTKPPHIGLEYSHNWVAITVTDYGIGIPQGDLQKVTDAFYRSDNVAGYEGTGLGLNLVCEIVNAHKGALLLTSPKEGGCIATIKLNY